ncbi:SOS response-associated peptidase family protein [Marinoscillum sp.]|uniref:SOS response-associated peptidase family protein n=1 Tax=Marinoscillum sp. TaxID=2024838 RepID=UPI003BA88779
MFYTKYTKERVIKCAKRHVLEVDPDQFPKDMHHAFAFSRRDLPVILDGQPEKIQPLKWGLVPFWTKDKAGAAKIARNTPNAMGETFFDKPEFRFAHNSRGIKAGLARPF